MSALSLTENEIEESVRYWLNLQALLRRSPTGSELKLKHPPPVALPAGYNLTPLFRSCNSDRQRRLLNRHLLCSLAIFGNLSKIPQPYPGLDITQDLFVEIDLTTFLAVSWIAVPVPVIQGNSATILTVMLGLAPGKGEVIFQTTPDIEQSSRKAFKIAFHALCFLGKIDREKDLLVWLLQDEDSISLTGTSLGLPVAIGLYLLQNMRQWPAGFFASGEITPEGHIRSVRHIREKAQAISRESQLFVIPVQNNSAVTGKDFVTIRTIKEAFFVVNCFQEGIHDGNRIALFQLAAKEPEILLGLFGKLPVEFFRLYDLATVLEKIHAKPEQYLPKVAICLKENSYKIEQAYFLVSLFSCEDIKKFAVADGFNALKYCLGNLAFHNHWGNNEKSNKWSVCAGEISTSLNRKSELSRLVNKDFVSERFNRYHFQPEVPALFTKCMQFEIKLHDLQEDDSLQLGAMYGTLAQNYGFCGPKYLARCREMVQMAISTFGNRFHKEHKRIQSYLVYALLDSKIHQEARSALQAYLDLPESTTAPDWLNKLTEIGEDNRRDYSFKVSLVCRFLAEQQLQLEGGVSAFASFQALIHETLHQIQHPWQLTATNLAHICLLNKEQEYGKELLNHAIAICMNGGETMQVMALLPLSLLYQFDIAGEEQFLLAMNLLNTIRSSNSIELPHFANLYCCKTGQEILEKTIKNKSSLFSFTYR